MSPRQEPCSLEAPLLALDRGAAGADEEPEPDTLRDWAPFRAAFEPAPTTVRSGDAPPDEHPRSERVAEEIERLFADFAPIDDADFELDGFDLGSSQTRIRAFAWRDDAGATGQAPRAHEPITEPPPARRAWG